MRATGRPVVLGVAAIGLLPFAWLVVGASMDRLGPEPVETITHVTGEWALRMLVLTLLVTPLRRLFGLSFVMPHRRTFGLLAFFYAALHFVTYLVFDLDLNWAELGTDIRDRPYITVGFGALLAMAPLALTSTRRSIRRLGKRWRVLHRLVYVAAAGAVLHFAWLVKADLREPLIYGGIVAALLGLRLYWALGRNRRSYATLPRSRDGETPAATQKTAPADRTA